MRKYLAVALSAAVFGLSTTMAFAHGGGGGGGGSHGGGSYYYSYYPGVSVPLVPPTKTGDYSKIHSVAVISAVGQSLMLGRTGLLASHSTLDIADWRLDQNVETLMGKLLATHYAVKDIPHDSAELAKIPNGFLDTSSAKALQSYIQALNAKDVDAILVIRPDAETGTPPTPGLSLEMNDATARPVEQANFEIDVVDAQSGLILAHAYSRAADRQGLPPQFAAFNGAKTLKLNPGDTPTAEQRNQLKLDYERNMALAIRETVRALNLGVTLPNIGSRNIVAIPTDQNPCRKLKRVMVISALGDRVEVDYPGSLFTKRKDHLVAITDWNFDSEVEKLATGAMDACFEVQNVPVDRAKLASFVIGPDKSVFTKPVDGITPGAPVDLYILFAKLTNEKADGISGLALWGGGGGDYGEAIAQYAVMLIEPKTAKIAYMMQGITSPKFPYPVPGREIVKTDIPNPGEAFSSNQAGRARTLFTAMMADSISETLLRLQFTGKKIESAATDLAEVAPAETTASGSSSSSAAP